MFHFWRLPWPVPTVLQLRLLCACGCAAWHLKDQFGERSERVETQQVGRNSPSVSFNGKVAAAYIKQIGCCKHSTEPVLFLRSTAKFPTYFSWLVVWQYIYTYSDREAIRYFIANALHIYNHIHMCCTHNYTIYFYIIHTHIYIYIYLNVILAHDWRYSEFPLVFFSYLLGLLGLYSRLDRVFCTYQVGLFVTWRTMRAMPWVEAMAAMEAQQHRSYSLT